MGELCSVRENLHKYFSSVVSVALRNPFLLLAGSYTLLALSVVFVPSKPTHRLGAVGLMVIFIFYSFRRADSSHVSDFNRNFCAGVQVGILLYSNFLLYLNPQ